MLYLNMGLCLFVIFAAIALVKWVLSDISGEYNMSARGARVLTLSIVRNATTVTGEMRPLNGSSLRLVDGSPPHEKNFDWLFVGEVGKDGRAGSKLRLKGTIGDGEIDGTIVVPGDSKRYHVKLFRDGISTLYKTVQSYFP